MHKELLTSYSIHQEKIKNKLQDFKELPESKYLEELMFCILTPQSNALRCWDAVQKIQELKNPSPNEIKDILKTRTRFHNNKTLYLLEAKNRLSDIQKTLINKDIKSLRNSLAENITGMGYKEAGHFLRNIGKSDNKIAILDRHILRNLKELGVIKEDSIKNKKHYLELEDKFLSFSFQMGIPINHLDLLFWSKETGEIFK